MPTIYPIGGGKGGVGKSFVAASLGALMAMSGRRVALVDLDLGASNLHTLLGIKSPASGLNFFLNKDVRLLDRVAVPTHISGLNLISSCHCAIEIANLHYAQKIKLIKAIRNLPYDAVILDLGAGTNFNTLDFFTAASNGVAICTPEPTAIENAFRFIKAVHSRRLKQIIKTGPYADEVKSVLLDRRNGGLKYSETVQCVETYDAGRLPLLKKQFDGFRFHIVINQNRRSTDPTLGFKLEKVCNRHFSAPFQFSGRIDFDERVHDAVNQKKLFVELFPNTSAALSLKHTARELIRYCSPATEKRHHDETAGT